MEAELSELAKKPVAELRSILLNQKFERLKKETNENLKHQIRSKPDDYKKPNVLASERFDCTFRAMIWNSLVDIIDEAADEEAKLYLLGETIKLDIKLFKDYLTINDPGISEAQKRKSEEILEGFTFAFSLKNVSKSEEYQENQRLNKQLYVTFENTLNYLNLIEFYLAPKLKKNTKLESARLVRSAWSVSVAIKHASLSGISMIISTFDTIIQQAFSNPNLTKSLVSFVLVAYMGFHPSFLFSSQTSQVTAMVLPLVARVLSFSKLFSRVTEMLTVVDKFMWISAINSSLQQAIELLEKVNHHLTQLIIDYVNCDPKKEPESQEKFFSEVDKIIKTMGKGASKLESFIESHQALTAMKGPGRSEKENEEGWVVVTSMIQNELEEITSTICLPNPKRPK